MNRPASWLARCGPPTAAGLLAIVALLTWGCDHQPVAVSFADYLEHQRDNVTTGLISVPGRINTRLLDHGWRLGENGQQYAEMLHRTGRVRFFAADRELRRLLLRGSSGDPKAARRYRVLINGHKVHSLLFGPELSEHRVELPEASLRRGANLLTLRCMECPPGDRHRGPRLRLAQLRLLPAVAHRASIRPGGGQAAERFLMPAPGYLDVVARLPQAARFRGELSLAGDPTGAARVTLSVLDADGEHQAGEWRLRRERRTLRTDLSAWGGRLVRLRLASMSDGAVELDWRRAVVTGRDGPADGGRLPLARPTAPPRSGRLGRPDILIVVLDAARADAFAPFGGPHPSPALERLAADGTRFTEARAPSSWTLPSVAALLTGFYPDSLGSNAWGMGMRLETPTLAELLATAGYRTVLWHQHPMYRGQPDLVRGFGETYWARLGESGLVPPAELLAAEDRPTFALIHLLPPHSPYEPPPPFRGRYSSWYQGTQEVSASALNRFHQRRDPGELSADDRRYIRDRYLENAAYADSLVGQIRDRLVSRGRYDSSLFVVLSDHGESFLEHGRFLHTQQLYRESIHVPLVAKWPRGTGGYPAVVDRPVSLVDVLPTVVDGLGLEGDLRAQGRSLLPLVLDGRLEDRAIYAVTRGAAEGWRPPAPRVALRHGNWAAIYAPLTDRVEIYDAAGDPAEQNDLAGERPLMALLLRQAALQQSALNRGLPSSGEPAAPERLDPEVEKQLRDLGYLGGN